MSHMNCAINAWKILRGVLRTMKISEMNNCIEKMRDCYKFEDDKTEIRLGNIPSGDYDRYVTVGTRDENGTQIEMTRRADELNKE